MTAKEIMQALIAGKKVGFALGYYYYLGEADNVITDEWLHANSGQFGRLFFEDGAKIIPEEEDI